ncbi:nitrogen regulatory protein P-II [archaeon BMS3Abin16]|nr:nitrogen regulatory protein P-II [archaeon BMS3Abin16]GBE56954.1 nitrogen regulatory protein P-II [archaeon BMS3Bbin16]
MKMIRAIVRPNKTEDVVEALEAGGFPALTKMDVYGRGKQRGIMVDEVYYDELPKTLLMLVVHDEDLDKVADLIVNNASTGKMGDGKIFVTDVGRAYTIRSRKEEL